HQILRRESVFTDASHCVLYSWYVAVPKKDYYLPSLRVSISAGLITTETGGTATFTVMLDTQPSADVSIGLTSSDLTEGTVAPASLTFTAANWNTAQTVTVTGVDDAIVDGPIAYTIVTASAVSADPN